MALQTPVTIPSSPVNHYTLNLILTENSTSVRDNTSSVSWQLQLVTSYYGFSGFRVGWSVSLAGRVVSSQVWSNASYSSIAKNNGTLIVASGTATVAHNADGSLNMAASASIFMDPSRTDAILPTRADATTGERSPSVSGAMPLTTIPRSSTLTAANGTLGTAQTLTINRASSRFTHTLSYTCGSRNAQRIWLDSFSDNGSGGLSGAWTPPVELADQNTAGQTVSVTFSLITFNGDDEVGRIKKTVSMAIPASVKPTASASVEVVNDNATVNAWGVAVRGYSKYKITTTFSNTNSQGSTLKSRSVKVNATGQTLTASPATSGVLASTDSTVKVQVTDSRDRLSDTVTVTGPAIYDYGNPTISEAVAYRCDSGGTSADSGTYLYVKCTASVSSCGGHNGKTVQYRYRVTGGNWTSWAALTSGTAQTVNAGLSAASSYEVQLRVTDTLGAARSVTVTIPTATVTLNLRAGGKGAAFGGYAQRDNAVDFTDWDVLGRVRGLGYCPEIPSNADLDSYITPGVYGVRTLNTAASLIHAPEAACGCLTVFSAAGARYDSSSSEIYLRQEYATVNGRVYQRYGTSTNGFSGLHWQDWALVYGGDAVIERGSSGDWYYRKWASGIVECWGYFRFTGVSITAAWGALYESTESKYLTFPDGLFARSISTCQLTQEGDVSFLEVGDGLSTTRSQKFWFARPVAQSSATCAVMAHAIGRWK